MGNFITDTVGKILGNVTQSVISALIVTAVTTYIIVSPGKKDNKDDVSKKDSLNTSTVVAPTEKSGALKEKGQTSETPSDTGTLENTAADAGVKAAVGNTKAIAVPATDTKMTPPGKESPATEAATKAYKELPPETPVEQKLERTITEGRVKGDSLLKAHPQAEKTKEVNKEVKKETKDVKKRSDEVFDELDQETQK